MAGLKSSMTVFMMIMMVAAIQMQTSTAQSTRHVVGDALGWTIPSNGAAAYTAWASQQTFTVGDTLFFNFTTGFHNVAEVSQAAYGPCTTANPISITTTGPATVSLTAAGTHYYICTVGTHCQIGQKLTINVSAPAVAPTTPPLAVAPTTPPPAPTPTTPPATTPTPTPTPTPAPVSPPATAPTTPPTPSEAPTPAGATPPSPPTSGPSGPPPTSDTTTPPPPPSAATRSLTTAAVPAALLAFGLALFY